ncbi:uncharacterized protein LOC131614611 [Vicia villosa]|uniref:uncharacterized protein LOC131614611 n=1 Tax=Vicia villosa TaxID=3911 RepID=UPI00273B4855|nr:uncharacterized protein LOC131614611 [Vicia villosa]
MIRKLHQNKKENQRSRKRASKGNSKWPFVRVDGCHLKTKYGGQLLIAVGRDPNDQYFPLALGVVENETKESWRWFIQILMEDIGQDKRYVFISNQQKEMFDRIEHRLCLRHLYANFKKFGGGTLIRDLMMGASKATYHQGWVQKMNELKKVDLDAWNWLMAVPTKCWCKHAFSFYPKCDVLMNNIFESFNTTILVARDKPILSICEWIRKYILNRVATSAHKLEKWQHRVMFIPRRRLDNEVFNSGHWLPTWSMNEKFQVTHNFNTQEFIVDIAIKHVAVTFGIWWEFLCRHVVVALSYRKQSHDDFVDECYTREKYAICYGFSVSPINGQDMWPKVEMNELPPLAYKQGPGRPRKVRIRESGEEGARKRRPGVAYKCTKCDQFGRNALTCKSLTQDPAALKRKRKVRAQKKATTAEEPTDAQSQPTNVQSEDIPKVVQNVEPANMENMEPTNVQNMEPTNVKSENIQEVV